MAYITFFQFLRRCLLLDAERYPPPDRVSKYVGATLNKTGTRRANQINRTEQTGRAGDSGDAGPNGLE